MAIVATDAVGPRTVRAEVNYVVDTGRLEKFHANDLSLDTVRLDPRTVEVVDGRTLPVPPKLDVNGFELFSMPSAVRDWRDDAHVHAVHPGEIQRFIQQVTGADAVVVTGPPILRFAERSREWGSRDGSYAARLIHSDAAFSQSDSVTKGVNPHPERTIRRSAHHNIWRAFSGPPVDVPLAVCDSTSVRDDDIVEALASFDKNGVVTWSFPAMTFRYSPAHRWVFFSNMRPEDVLVFKRYDTDGSKARYVPHVAITDPTVGDEATPRASVEMRTVSYWYA